MISYHGLGFCCKTLYFIHDTHSPAFTSVGVPVLFELGCACFRLFSVLAAISTDTGCVSSVFPFPSTTVNFVFHLFWQFQHSVII